MDTYKKKYKELVAWINLLSHSALTIDQHKIVDAILERSEKLAESEDEKIRKELIEHIKANKEADYVLFKKFSPDDVIAWLEKQGEHHIACSEEQMKVLDEVLNFAANHESPYWNDYIFETLNNLIRQLKN